MVNKRLFRLLLLFSVLSLAGQLVLYPRMPQRVPIHWNANGYIDGWGHKWINLMLGSVPLLSCLGMYILPKVDPRQKNYHKYPKAYNIIATAVVILMAGFSWVTTLVGLGIKIPVAQLIQVLVGLLLITLGNFMPQFHSNFFFGIRTPWALASDEVWRKTHRVGGIVFVVAGILLVASAFLPMPALLPMAVLLVGIVFVYVYSYLAYRRLGDGKP